MINPDPIRLSASTDDVIVRPKRPKKLPCVLSKDEILSIIDQVDYLKHKVILLTTYSSGLRISETLNLRVSDIDSERMLIRVNQRKGNKDRLTILSLENLKMLRTYWKLFKPTDLLFPGQVLQMPELQDIFNHVRLDSMSPAQAKAFNMIRHCRTAKLGYHAEVCPECGSVEVSYNSCRNRHCPKCQHSAQEDWVESQMSKLLPVGYFHLVFTIPQELNTLVFQNQRLLYSILIQSAGHTLIELAKDPKFLGATTGVTSVLHTWGQNLSFHPERHVFRTCSRSLYCSGRRPLQ